MTPVAILIFNLSPVMVCCQRVFLVKYYILALAVDLPARKLAIRRVIWVQVQALTDELESSQDGAQAREDQLQADLAASQRQVCSLLA